MIPLFDDIATTKRPVVTKFFLWANVAAFIVQHWFESEGASWFTAAYGLVPARLHADPAFEWTKLLSSMFLHGGFWHLAWNLWFLHIFGDNVEDAIGRGRYVAFYLLSGIAAGLAQYFIDPLSPIPMVGASGAIAGVLGAYLVLYPRAPVHVLNPILPLWLLFGPFFVFPAWLVAGEWFVGNLFGGLASLGGSGGGVAFFAHLGGFLFGLVTVRLFLLGMGFESRRREARTSRGSPGRRTSNPARRIFWKEEDRPFWK